MNLLKNLFGGKQQAIQTNQDFWNWFQKNERGFLNTIKERKQIERDFIKKLGPKLHELNEEYYFLVGMSDEETANLIFTADGNVKNIVFIEKLVEEAPAIDAWQFTALKPPLAIENVGIRMADFEFKEEKLHFYANVHSEYPDEIDITVIHDDFDEENESVITNGVYIFLDNFLGEMLFATTIDNLNVIGKDAAKEELVPIAKLKDFLTWRQKEFVEKYEGTWSSIDEDAYTVFKAESGSGNALIATINTTVLKWDAKASHPWMVKVAIAYNGQRNEGMPTEETLAVCNEIEDEIMDRLKDKEGYLNTGRETGDHCMEIYFACKEFRKPSLVLQEIAKKYTNKLTITYEIQKDKYWQSLNRFNII